MTQYKGLLVNKHCNIHTLINQTRSSLHHLNTYDNISQSVVLLFLFKKLLYFFNEVEFLKLTVNLRDSMKIKIKNIIFIMLVFNIIEVAQQVVSDLQQYQVLVILEVDLLEGLKLVVMGVSCQEVEMVDYLALLLLLLFQAYSLYLHQSACEFEMVVPQLLKIQYFILLL